MQQKLSRRDFLWASVSVLTAFSATTFAFTPNNYVPASEFDKFIYAEDGTKIATIVKAMFSNKELIVENERVYDRTLEVEAIAHNWQCENFEFTLPVAGSGKAEKACRVICRIN